MRRLAGNFGEILKIWLNRGGKWYRLLRERSPKRQQPFSAPLPAKGETLLDLSGSDLSKMQCAIVESFVFLLIIFLPKHYLKKKELFWAFQDGACLQKMHCALAHCAQWLFLNSVSPISTRITSEGEALTGLPNPIASSLIHLMSICLDTYFLVLVTWL